MADQPTRRADEAQPDRRDEAGVRHPALERRLTRRTFLEAGLATPLLAAAARRASAQNAWRNFEITVRVDLVAAEDSSRLWLPLAIARVTPYQRALAQTWTGEGATVELYGDPASAAPMLIADWPTTANARTLTLTMRVATRGHRVSLERPAAIRDIDERVDVYLRPTRMIPTTGIVRDTALKIVQGHASALSRARAIYDWIVDNTFRDPSVKGCGLGDIRWMLESGTLGGKCADLNGLFVGLCRSVGLPARDLYGLRVAPSERFQSLGRRGDVTTGQHCRAEVWIDEFGWIPVDPADVRKVVLEEEPLGTVNSPQARFARAQLFGSWEMNWIAFNDAHDVALPGSKGPLLPFFMYPQAEVGGVRRDSLDPASFRYRITATELASPGPGDLVIW
jgi:transglutaminase-like putative cysteine protease